jgi:hypothetical protein
MNRQVTREASRPRIARTLALGALFLIATGVALTGLPAVGSAADTSGITMSVYPGDTTMSPGDTAMVDVVFSNTTNSAVLLQSISVRVPAGVVTVSMPSAASIGAIPPAGFKQTKFSLRALPGVEDGSVDVLAAVKSTASKGVALTQMTEGSITLNAGDLSRQPDVTFLSFPEKLNDGQSATAALRISNPTSTTLRHIQVSAVDSQDVQLTSPKLIGKQGLGTCQASGTLICVSRLPPGRTAVVSMQAKAAKKVQTGTQHVSVVVQSQDSTASDVSTVTAGTSVQVAIFGVDALSPLGLTSLFILPGLVSVLVFLMFSRFVYPRSKQVPETVSVTDPRMLLFVAPPAAFAYLVVWAAWGINLSQEAGTNDVAILFALGFAIGLLAWAAVATIYYVTVGRKNFKANDQPKTVLGRLEARNARLSLPRIETAPAGGPSYQYLCDSGSDKLLACSPIKYSFAPDAEKKARQNFRVALSHDDIGAVRGAVRRKEVRLFWLLPTGVTTIERSAVQFRPEYALLTEGDPDGDE